MPRHALRTFLRSFVLVGTLPLTGCIFGPCEPPPRTNSTITTLGDGGFSDAGCVEACERTNGYGEVTSCQLSAADGDGGVAGDGGTAGDGGASEQLVRVTCTVKTVCIGGRRPAGLAEATVDGTSELGRFFARMAHLEAASVGAFERLAAELEALGAPRRLIAMARRSARDEVRHARVVGALAARHGAAVPAVDVAPSVARTPVAIAVENSVTGCVEETWAAVVASWQGRNARDARVRAALARIAEDETRHAELAWDVAAWFDRTLDGDERRRVREARRAAVEQLITQLDAEVAPELVELAGLPRPAEARALAAAAAATLWA